MMETNKFGHHWTTSYDFGCHLMAMNKFNLHLMTNDFGCHLMAINRFDHHQTISYDFGCC